MAFDTFDIGASFYHDENGTIHTCTNETRGAWWYDTCHHSNLNGDYSATGTVKAVNWGGFRGYNYSLKRTEMKLRRL